MFIPKYTITNQILQNISSSEVAREIINKTPMAQGWEVKFRRDAYERIIHHITHLEGNSLNLEEVRDLLDGHEVVGSEKDITEVRNYQNVLKFVDTLHAQIGSNNRYLLTIEMVTELHRLTLADILSEEALGVFRQKQVVIRNTKTDEISYTPPPAVEVSYLMEDLVVWTNSEESRSTHPLLKAGIIHFEIMRIHPFIDGNSRVARAVANLIMCLEGYDLKKFVALEEYFDINPMQYYLTLHTVSNQEVLDTSDRDLTAWLEYYTKKAAEELLKVKDKVQRLASETRVKSQLGEQIELTERQMMIMEYLHRHKSMSNKDFRKVFPDFSDDTVLRELKFLRKKGLITKSGGTKKAVYILK